MTDDTDAELVQSVLRRGGDGYQVRTVSAAGPGLLRIHLTVSRPHPRDFSLLVNAPHSDAPQPWLYMTPIDVSEWAAMLGVWLDESLTAGASHLAVEERDGVASFAVELYGLRLRDRIRHRHLSAVAPSWVGDFRLPE